MHVLVLCMHVENSEIFTLGCSSVPFLRKNNLKLFWRNKTVNSLKLVSQFHGKSWKNSFFEVGLKLTLGRVVKIRLWPLVNRYFHEIFAKKVRVNFRNFHTVTHRVWNSHTYFGSITSNYCVSTYKTPFYSSWKPFQSVIRFTMISFLLRWTRCLVL